MFNALLILLIVQAVQSAYTVRHCPNDFLIMDTGLVNSSLLQVTDATWYNSNSSSSDLSFLQLTGCSIQSELLSRHLLSSYDDFRSLDSSTAFAPTEMPLSSTVLIKSFHVLLNNMFRRMSIVVGSINTQVYELSGRHQ